MAGRGRGNGSVAKKYSESTNWKIAPALTEYSPNGLTSPLRYSSLDCFPNTHTAVTRKHLESVPNRGGQGEVRKVQLGRKPALPIPTAARRDPKINEDKKRPALRKRPGPEDAQRRLSSSGGPPVNEEPTRGTKSKRNTMAPRPPPSCIGPLQLPYLPPGALCSRKG